MSDALVARLREGAQWLPRPTHDTCAALMTDAADRIEALEAERDQWESQNERLGFQLMDIAAERDTLAEMVRVISPRVERDDYGAVGVVAGRNFYSSTNWTDADAERFQRVLDKLDPEDGGRDV